MQKNNISYAYPVLGNGDDVAGDFKISAEMNFDKNETRIIVDFILQNDYIAELIRAKRAKFLLEVQCPSIFLNETYVSEDSHREIVIDSSRIKNRIVCFPYIVATDYIDSYSPPEVSDIYKSMNTSFEVTPGDIIAIGGVASAIVDLDFDPLTSRVSSFIKIRKIKSSEKDIRVDYNSDNIEILMPEPIFEHFSYISNNSRFKNLIHSSVVLPVLVDALHNMVSGDEMYGIWKDKLEALCRSRGIEDIDGNELLIAQSLLKSPIHRTMSSLDQVDEEYFDE